MTNTVISPVLNTRHSNRFKRLRVGIRTLGKDWREKTYQIIERPDGSRYAKLKPGVGRQVYQELKRGL